MDQDTFNSYMFLAFGLGFFLFVIHYIVKDDNRRQDREHELALRRKPARELPSRKRRIRRS